MTSRSTYLIVRQFSTFQRKTFIKTNKPKFNKPDPTQSSWDHVYGISSVLGALHSKKRSVLDTLYIQHVKEEQIKTTQKKDDQLMSEITQLAMALQIKLVVTDKGRMNNMTDSKPHQGVVLKSSKRETIDISELSTVENNQYTAMPKLNKRGSEEDRKKNASIEPIHFTGQRQRTPFWIALDEVQDPQNLGSILRTAHFFGVDGVLLCSKNSAPLSPTVSKVSSGAVEVMDIYATSNLVKFLHNSHANGWHVVGAAGDEDATPSVTTTSQWADVVREKPTILVLGNEGTGLRTNVKHGCNMFVRIPKAHNKDDFYGSVDSLNVGVAAGVLISSALS